MRYFLIICFVWGNSFNLIGQLNDVEKTFEYKFDLSLASSYKSRKLNKGYVDEYIFFGKDSIALFLITITKERLESSFNNNELYEQEYPREMASKYGFSILSKDVTKYNGRKGLFLSFITRLPKEDSLFGDVFLFVENGCLYQLFFVCKSIEAYNSSKNSFAEVLTTFEFN